MTNLKKTLAVVLAFAMVFSMGLINTFAYTDVEAGTVTDEAVGILSNLNILNGFEDGTFKPDDTVTRAQMAAIICRTLGFESQAKSSMGSTAFNDVAADHWASGYINVAQAQGIINGFPDGSFQPEAQVTYEQAIKMVVVALGYDLVAQAKGGYPSGYLAIASSEGISKNANGKVGDAAKRSTVAIVVYNSLEVRLMDQKSWTSNGEDEYGKTDDTILSKYLEVQKWEGVVTSTPFVDYVSSYDKDATPSIDVDGFYTEYVDGVEVKNTDKATDIDASLIDADSYFGKYVVAYIGAEEDDETGNIMVYAIKEKQNKNKVVSIADTQLVDADDKEWDTAGQISYRNVGSSKVYDLDLDDDVQFYVNYEADSLDNTATTEDVAGKFTDGGTLELISNDNDDKIEFVVINAYSDVDAVIEKVTEEEGVFMFDLFTGDLDDIDTTEDTELAVIYKDGALADAKALAANDTVSVINVGKDVRVIYASSKTVTGAVSAYDDETVTIGGVDYELNNAYTEPADLKDKEGTFFINVAGKIAYDEADATTSGTYGLVLAVDAETGITDGYVAQVALSDGTVAEYDLAPRAKFYDAAGDQKGSDDKETADKMADAIEGTDVTLGSVTAKLDADNAIASIFRFTIKDGEITKVRAVADDGDEIDYTDGRAKRYDAEAMTYGSMSFDANTVVFAVDKAFGANEVTDKDVTVGKVSDFLANDDESLAIYAYTEKNQDYATFAIGFELSASVPEDSDAIIVTSNKSVTYNDDTAAQITGIQAGKEVTYTIYDEDGDYTDESADPAKIAKGDVILVAAANAEGVTSDYKTLVDADASTKTFTLKNDAAKGDASDDIYNTVANLVADKTTAAKFYLDADVYNFGANGTDDKKKSDDVIWAVAADGITAKASANYTLVDYSDSTKNPEISKKNPGTSLFSKRYESQVFVRVYDDKLVEVVVYRFAK